MENTQNLVKILTLHSPFTCTSLIECTLAHVFATSSSRLLISPTPTQPTPKPNEHGELPSYHFHCSTYPSLSVCFFLLSLLRYLKQSKGERGGGIQSLFGFSQIPYTFLFSLRVLSTALFRPLDL